MATNNEKFVVAASASAAVASALALWRSGSKVAAADVLGLDAPTMALLAAIGQATGEIDDQLAQVLNYLQSGGAQTTGNQPAVPNAKTAVFTRMYPPPIVGAAANAVYQLGSLVVPDTMELIIKGWYLNAGWAFIGNSIGAVQNPSTSAVYPLAPNEPFSLKVSNANSLWASVVAAGDSIVYGAEQR